LQLALERWTGGEVAVRYRAFLLNPNLPPEGADFHTVMRAKGGGSIPLEYFFQAPTEKGAAVGLRFNFEAITRAPNSLLSHELAALTPLVQQGAVLESIYAAYFEHGLDIGSLEVLLDIAGQHNLDRYDVRTQLENHAARGQVMDEIEQAHALGIQGVPFFVFNRRYGLSGAQPPEMILQAMQAAGQG
jgi:predicted DsbA family dithiol-disulfide isomerase